MSAVWLFLINSLCSPINVFIDRYANYHPEIISNCRTALVAAGQATNLNNFLKQKEIVFEKKAYFIVENTLPKPIIPILLLSHQILISQEFNLPLTKNARVYYRLDNSVGIRYSINF